MTTEAAPCPGRGGLFDREDGPAHPYMLGSPGCWNAYGAVLAREYQSPALFAACHRLTVDAYALQHPGNQEDRRARQSIRLHYASLEAIFDRGASLDAATALLKQLAHRPAPPIGTRPERWSVTLADIVAADPADHVTAVRRWARAAFEGWRPVLAS